MKINSPPYNPLAPTPTTCHLNPLSRSRITNGALLWVGTRSPSLRNQHPMIEDNSFVYWTYRADYSNHHIVLRR